MTGIHVGKWVASDKSATMDLERLLETRMLIQANSGGGKSFTLRRLLEQSAGVVQQIIIDPEGEFASLREKHDAIIAAPHGGDALAHPKTAKLLAERLLETGVSAVLDIYDLKAHERQSFVRVFLDAVMNAPRALWHPAMIVLDEAHLFCPEKGDSEAARSVIDVATRGRKRGYCLIAATQRLAKLHKDCAAELLNKMIGRTGLDIDVRRAADELGMPYKAAVETLRALPAGVFYALGPAMNVAGVDRMAVGPVKTSHPKVGERLLRAPPAPTAAIRAILPKLADLPREAEAEARTVDDLRRENAALKRELTIARRGAPVVDPSAIKDAERRGYEKGASDAGQEAKRRLESFARSVGQMVTSALNMELNTPATKQAITRPQATSSVPRAPTPVQDARVDGVSAMARKILAVLAQHRDGCEAGKLTLLTGYRFSGGFRNALSELRTRGLIEGGNSEAMRITDAGLACGPFPALPVGDDLLNYWLNHPSFGKQAREILAVLASNRDGLTASALCSLTGYEFSGGFRNSLSALRTAGVIVGKNSETMRIAASILP